LRKPSVQLGNTCGDLVGRETSIRRDASHAPTDAQRHDTSTARRNEIGRGSIVRPRLRDARADRIGVLPRELARSESLEREAKRGEVDSFPSRTERSKRLLDPCVDPFNLRHGRQRSRVDDGNKRGVELVWLMKQGGAELDRWGRVELDGHAFT
jgi:hypothetical protein